MDNRFSEVGHHANEVGVPLVCNLGKRPAAKEPYRLGVCGDENEVWGQACSSLHLKKPLEW